MGLYTGMRCIQDSCKAIVGGLELFSQCARDDRPMITGTESGATFARVSLVGDKGKPCLRRPTLGLTLGSTGCCSYPVSVTPRILQGP